MELKVWVDGIQRVVCGADYNTTCQDVVIALASAMGRTGRFTLVEKWRDSERPLFPGECPLQALYKWGEYAGEVRFYLVQAATVNVKQKEEVQHKWEAQTQKPHVVNKFKPVQLSENRLNSPEAESLRRSSTFSGAHRTDYTPVLSTPAVTSSHQSPALSSSTSSQRSTVQSSIALARGQPAGIASVPNGELTGLPSVLMNGSSSQSSSKQLSYVPRTTSGGLPSGFQPPDQRDARQLHPANMPAALSSFLPSIKDYPSDSSFKQSMSSKSSLMPSDKPPSQNQRYVQQIPSLSSASPSAMSSKYHNMVNTTASYSFPSPQLQHSLLSQQSQSKSHLLQQQQHQQQQQQQQHLQPTSHLQLLPSSSEHENIPAKLRPHHQHPQKRERSQDKKAQMSPSATVPSDPHAFSKTVLNNNRTETSHMDTTVYGHHYDNAMYSDINITRSTNQPGYSDRVSHGLFNSHSSVPQDRAPSKDSLHTHYHNRTDLVRSATIDRHLAQSKVSDLPSRSYSTGDSSHELLKHSHEGQTGNLQQQFALGHPRQGAVENKFTFVDSAVMKHQKPCVDGYNQRPSSFSSAVAHARNQGDSSVKSTTAETMVTRQHILNNTQEGSPSERNVHNGIVAVHGTHVGETNGGIGSSATGQQYQPHSLQFGYKSPVPFNSISSSQLPSAFTPVSPKPSHEPKLSVMYNLNSIDTSSDHQQIQDLSNSSQTSLEIEEYDLDRNFPDVLHRDAAGSRGAQDSDRPSVTAKHYQEDGMLLSQSDRDYMQLLRIVSVQQERIKTQEALISEASMEISVLEEEECSKLAQLEMLAEDISHMEKQEIQLREELEALQRIDWDNLLDNEQRREAEINLQMKSLKEGLDKMESQVKQLSQEADQISQNLKTEEEQINEQKRKNEELEKQIISEMVWLKDQLANLNKTISDSGKKLQDVEKHILEADAQLKQQEEEMNSLTEKLKVQVVTTSWSRPHSPEASSSPSAGLGADTAASVNTLSTTDNGEAILKILEDRLSPRSPENAGDGYGNVSSTQHVYKSAMSVKNPNGVWV